jgi:hypothetical protein
LNHSSAGTVFEFVTSTGNGKISKDLGGSGGGEPDRNVDAEQRLHLELLRLFFTRSCDLSISSFASNKY